MGNRSCTMEKLERVKGEEVVNQRFRIGGLDLDGAYLIEPFVAYDERGCLVKDYSIEIFEQYGISYDLSEIFYTYSKAGVIRAIHFQKVKQQPKLVRCVAGEVYDVIVDLRKTSATFGKWHGFWLSEENKRELLIPAGFGHGYLVTRKAIVSYKCAEKFYGEYDDGIIWDDSEIGIEWPLERVKEVILSEKDKNLQTFLQFKERNKGGFIV